MMIYLTRYGTAHVNLKYSGESINTHLKNKICYVKLRNLWMDIYRLSKQPQLIYELYFKRINFLEKVFMQSRYAQEFNIWGEL